MYPATQFHQEIARQRHADLLREARLASLAGVIDAERHASPHRRLAHALRDRAATLLTRGRFPQRSAIEPAA